MEKVEKIQYQAALAITGAWQGSSRSKIYDEFTAGKYEYRLRQFLKPGRRCIIVRGRN